MPTQVRREKGRLILLSSLDEVAQTFRLGALTVDYSDNALIVPAGASVAEGRVVVVFSNSPPAAGVLQASGIRVLQIPFADGHRTRVAGLIRDLDAQAQTFRLYVSTIDASKACFVRGSAADLANGRRASVLGTVRIAADGERIIEASTVWVGGLADSLTTVAGPVKNYASAGSFSIRGVLIDASADSVRFVNGTADNLADGVWLRVIGSPDGEKIGATTIEFFEPAGDRQRAIAGFIRDSDSASGSLQIFGIRVQVVDTTRVVSSTGRALAVEALRDGVWAVAKGQYRSGQLVADEIRLRDGASVVIDEIEGLAYRIDASAGRFTLNGIVARVDGQLIGSEVVTTLRAGHRVRVSGMWIEGEFVVTSMVRI